MSKWEARPENQFPIGRVSISGGEKEMHICIKPERNPKRIGLMTVVILFSLFLASGLGYWTIFVIKGMTMGILFAFVWLGVIAYPFIQGLFAQFCAEETLSVANGEVCVGHGGSGSVFPLIALDSVQQSDTVLHIGFLEAYHNIFIYDRGRVLFNFNGQKKLLRFGKCLSVEETEAILGSLTHVLQTVS